LARAVLLCDITSHTVLLYVLFCLTYMYCTLYILYMLYTVPILMKLMFVATRTRPGILTASKCKAPTDAEG